MKPSNAGRGLLILAATLGACHPAARRPSLGPKAGQMVGDTTAFGPRLLDIDARAPFVTFEVTAPAHVLLISVTPGESAIPIGALASDMTLAEPGIHRLRFVPVPRTPSPAPSVSSWGSADQTDYDRCVRAGSRRMPKRRVVRTDTAGRTVQVSNEPVDPKEEVDIERRCEGNINRRLKSTASPPPRFLVLIASNTPLMLADAIQRFETMRNIPGDMTAAVNAIASTLYGDRKGIWSAHYIAW